MDPCCHCCRPRRSASVLYPRLLAARQRVLSGMGFHSARPRPLHGLDGAKRVGERAGMSQDLNYMPEEMMTIAAARRFRDNATCFVGVGWPSTAACLAHLLYAPKAILVYESGAIGSKPQVSPLSIADPELADTAIVIASVTEIFGLWLQGGRIDIGFLAAAQIDQFGNINSTVIGDYDHPKVR